MACVLSLSPIRAPPPPLPREESMNNMFVDPWPCVRFFDSLLSTTVPKKCLADTESASFVSRVRTRLNILKDRCEPRFILHGMLVPYVNIDFDMQTYRREFATRGSPALAAFDAFRQAYAVLRLVFVMDPSIYIPSQWREKPSPVVVSPILNRLRWVAIANQSLQSDEVLDAMWENVLCVLHGYVLRYAIWSYSVSGSIEAFKRITPEEALNNKALDFYNALISHPYLPRAGLMPVTRVFLSMQAELDSKAVPEETVAMRGMAKLRALEDASLFTADRQRTPRLFRADRRHLLFNDWLTMEALHRAQLMGAFARNVHDAPVNVDVFAFFLSVLTK